MDVDHVGVGSLGALPGSLFGQLGQHQDPAGCMEGQVCEVVVFPQSIELMIRQAHQGRRRLWTLVVHRLQPRKGQSTH